VLIDGVPLTTDVVLSDLSPEVREEAAQVLSAVVDALRPQRPKRLPLRDRLRDLPPPAGREDVRRQLDVLCEYARGDR
jgi:hypothetical protein